MAYRNQARRPAVDQNRFTEVPNAQIPRSTFDRSYGHKFTFDAGRLIPILVEEILPGDTFTFNMQGFARLATPIKPIMDNMWLETFFFFVPNRLVWDNWQKFNGEQDSPGDSTDFVIPQCILNPADNTSNSLFDYMGIPPNPTWTQSINALPMRGYRLIYDEWFRDQNLSNSRKPPTDDGPDDVTSYGLEFRAKRHDYFTSALPWPQKGDSVTIPVADRAPIAVDLGAGNAPTVNSTVDGQYTQLESQAAGPAPILVGAGAGVEANALYADLTTATATTINALRQAFQIQKLLERDARGGTRYTEIIRAHFGVTSPDMRLQRPEYLGGGRTPLNMAPVAQTSPTGFEGGPTSVTPQANLSGIGTVTWSGHGWSKSFTEHGYVIGLIQARADLTYQQGIHRMWSRQTRYDFYWPALSHIGEQAVLNKEIYNVGGPDDELVFGYAERYAEYRFSPSRISGDFRSAAAQPLDIWHLSENFTTRPSLDNSFIQDRVPALKDRVVATPTEPDFICDTWFNLKCARPMPVYGVPGMIDHF